MSKSKLINIKEFKEILNNLSPDYQVRVYDVDKKRRSKLVSKPKKKRYTLNQIGDLVVEMSSNLKQVNTRLDNLEKDVKGLKQDVKDINARLNHVEKRLDYNNLKQLPISE